MESLYTPPIYPSSPRKAPTNQHVVLSEVRPLRSARVGQRLERIPLLPLRLWPDRHPHSSQEIWSIPAAALVLGLIGGHHDNRRSQDQRSCTLMFTETQVLPLLGARYSTIVHCCELQVQHACMCPWMEGVFSSFLHLQRQAPYCKDPHEAVFF